MGSSLPTELLNSCRREIHPLDTRSAGQSLNVFVNLLFTFVIGQSFLAMLCGMKFGVFLFFAGVHLTLLTHATRALLHLHPN